MPFVEWKIEFADFISCLYEISIKRDRILFRYNSVSSVENIKLLTIIFAKMGQNERSFYWSRFTFKHVHRPFKELNTYTISGLNWSNIEVHHKNYDDINTNDNYNIYIFTEKKRWLKWMNEFMWINKRKHRGSRETSTVESMEPSFRKPYPSPSLTLYFTSLPPFV